MTASKVVCIFKPNEEYRDPDYQCNHPVTEDNLCIFHLPKPSEKQKQEMAPEIRALAEETDVKFCETFVKLLHKSEKDTDLEQCDFRYFSFPAINFDNQTFSKDIIFSGATFNGYISFRGAIFKKSASFREAIFFERADFTGVFFHGKADYWAATFSGVTFSGGKFYEESCFVSTNFSGRTGFWATEFIKSVRFNGAAFRGKTEFIARFNERAVFTGAHFLASIKFEVCNGKDFRKESDFSNIELNENSKVVFYRVNLSQSSFLDTDLERIQFRDVQWYRKHQYDRQAIWDEFLLKKCLYKSSPCYLHIPSITGYYEKIAENYRQLVLKYEAKRDFDTAEDFHIGEMEIRRTRKGAWAIDKVNEAENADRQYIAKMWRGWRATRELINGYAFYWLLSKYGTSYWRGFLALLVLVVIFSGAFLYTGFSPSKENFEQSGQHGIADYTPVIEYNIIEDATHHPVPCRQWVGDYGKSIVFTLSILTFQKERFYEPTSTWSQLWLCIAVFALTGQTALILFAIRRRYKR